MRRHNHETERCDIRSAMEAIPESYGPVFTPVRMVDDSSSTTMDDIIENVEYGADFQAIGNANDQARRAMDGGESDKRWCGLSANAMEKHVPVIMSITLGAYFGVGVRVLLTEFANALESDQTALLKLLGFSFFLPNAVGCFVMGFAVRWKPLLRDQYAVLLTGITTGFCGCCTTFASWDVGVSAMFVHDRWLNALLVLAVQVCGAMGSFRAGYHAGEGVIESMSTHYYPFGKPTVHMAQLKLDLDRNIAGFRAIKTNTFGQLVSRRVRATEEALVVSREACNELLSEIAEEESELYPVRHNGKLWLFFGLSMTVLLWIFPFIGFGNYPSSRLLGVCLGPFGALLRYYLSLFNAKPIAKNFPLFTFIPNIAASYVSCVLEIIGSVALKHGGDASRVYVLLGEGGLLVGFCGSLSTVSTWINELDTLASRRLFWSYRYAFVSLIISQLGSAIILGVWVAHGTAPLLV